jgi:hypothetical protein
VNSVHQTWNSFLATESGTITRTREIKHAYKIGRENPKRRAHLEETGADRTIILKA